MYPRIQRAQGAERNKNANPYREPVHLYAPTNKQNNRVQNKKAPQYIFQMKCLLRPSHTPLQDPPEELANKENQTKAVAAHD